MEEDFRGEYQRPIQLEIEAKLHIFCNDMQKYLIATKILIWWQPADDDNLHKIKIVSVQKISYIVGKEHFIWIEWLERKEKKREWPTLRRI